MAARLTDKQKKAIIAEYASVGNYSAVGRKYGVSDNAVRKIVNSNPESSRLFEQKKEQNTADILAHMEGKKEAVCKLIDVYLDELVNPARLARATPAQLSTALGTVIDKFTMVPHKQAFDRARLLLEREKAGGEGEDKEIRVAFGTPEEKGWSE